MKSKILFFALSILFASTVLAQSKSPHNLLFSFKEFSQKVQTTNATDKLDSIVSDGYMKQLFTYDTINNKYDEIVYYLDWNNQWEISHKHEYAYDINGNVIEYIEYFWDLGAWVANFKYEIFYDANNLFVEQIQYHSSQPGVWEPQVKTEVTYTSTSEFLQVLFYYYDDINTTWELDSKYDYVYDGNGFPSSWLSSYWNTNINDWEVSEKSEFVCNANGQIIQEIYAWWDSMLNQWINSSKMQYTYDGNGFKSEEIEYYWDNILNIWEPQSKYEYTNNPQGKVLQNVNFFYDSQLLDWERSWKEESQYDIHNNLVITLGYGWDGSNWELFTKDEYVYNLNFTLNDFLAPHWYSENYNTTHMLSSISHYYWDINQWVLSESENLYYSSLIVSAKNTAVNKDISVFPNPAKEILNIMMPHEAGEMYLEVYDIKGQIVLCLKSDKSIDVDINSLKPGMYLYNILYKNKKYKGKFIKS